MQNALGDACGGALSICSARGVGPPRLPRGGSCHHESPACHASAQSVGRRRRHVPRRRVGRRRRPWVWKCPHRLIKRLSESFSQRCGP